ncbi:hypothetical protein D3C76_1847380 [compost metagenome]
MLGKEINEVPSYFGTYLTPENIEQHLKNLRLSRQGWSEHDKDMVEILDYY